MWVWEQTSTNRYYELSRQLPGVMSYFISGAALYYYRDFFQRYAWYFLACAVVVLAVNNYQPLPPLEPLALAVVVIFLALHFYLGNFTRFGDFSYGVYILHFPIIQLLIHSGEFERQPAKLLLVTVVLTTLGAVILWHLVEKRFLSRGSHYVAATGAPVGRSDGEEARREGLGGA
jgi:peptidoglycan/LPS O-acetylase OafA/YrhL